VRTLCFSELVYQETRFDRRRWIPLNFAGASRFRPRVREFAMDRRRILPRPDPRRGSSSSASSIRFSAIIGIPQKIRLAPLNGSRESTRLPLIKKLIVARRVVWSQSVKLARKAATLLRKSWYRASKAKCLTVAPRFLLLDPPHGHKLRSEFLMNLELGFGRVYEHLAVFHHDRRNRSWQIETSFCGTRPALSLAKSTRSCASPRRTQLVSAYFDESDSRTKRGIARCRFPHSVAVSQPVRPDQAQGLRLISSQFLYGMTNVSSQWPRQTIDVVFLANRYVSARTLPVRRTNSREASP